MFQAKNRAITFLKCKQNVWLGKVGVALQHSVLPFLKIRAQLCVLLRQIFKACVRTTE